MIRLEPNLFYACYGFEYKSFYLTLKDLDNLTMVNKMCYSVMTVTKRHQFFVDLINDNGTKCVGYKPLNLLQLGLAVTL